MKRPHCLVEIHGHESITYLGDDVASHWGIRAIYCPNKLCDKYSFFLINGVFKSVMHTYSIQEIISEKLVHPKGISRNAIPPEVPMNIANDYKESCMVLPDSPKASAALSRRCLQYILKDQGATKRNLADQIDEIINRKELPSWLSEELHTLREIGNFAAHPNKSKVTGELLEVESGEAENNLNVIENLFDFYYVQPAKAKQRRDSLNSKLGR